MHKVKYEELGHGNADAGDYIDDFRKSDAQFKGKSDKKIRKMAIAYLDSKEKK